MKEIETSEGIFRVKEAKEYSEDLNKIMNDRKLPLNKFAKWLGTDYNTMRGYVVGGIKPSANILSVLSQRGYDIL